jgi:hypothetical protein
MKKVFFILIGFFAGMFFLNVYKYYKPNVIDKNNEIFIDKTNERVNRYVMFDSLMRYNDSSIYNKLKTEYLKNQPCDFFAIALIMANKYDYAPAYFDVYFSMFTMFDTKKNSDAVKYNLLLLDEQTRQLSLNCLKIAYDKGYPDAQNYYNKVHRGR